MKLVSFPGMQYNKKQSKRGDECEYQFKTVGGVLRTGALGAAVIGWQKIEGRQKKR